MRCSSGFLSGHLVLVLRPDDRAARARRPHRARRAPGPLFAGFLKIFPVVFLVFPGVIAYAIFRNVIGNQANQTLPVLINQLVPTGSKGLIAAAVLAALMSGVSAALNSTGTLVAVDIVGRLVPRCLDRAQASRSGASAHAWS